MAKIGDEAVKKATGKDWSEWLKLLDRKGAKKLDHRGIVAIVGENGVGPWWQQMVAVTYEQERGLRDVLEQDGSYVATVSRTFNAPVADVYDAIETFLRKQKAMIRKKTAPKSMRVTWNDDTSIEIGFYAKGDKKSQVAVQHSKLKNSKDVAARKKFWSDALDALKEKL